jgi:hypothetical protein
VAGNADTVREIHAGLLGEDGTILLGDQSAAQALISELAAPGFSVKMVGAGGFAGTFEGPEGFTRGWLDFIEGFENVRIVGSELIELGDTVVDLVTLDVRVARGDVPLSTDAAAVWRFSGDRLAGVEFHLDREEALRSAGAESGAGG